MGKSETIKVAKRGSEHVILDGSTGEELTRGVSKANALRKYARMVEHQMNS